MQGLWSSSIPTVVKAHTQAGSVHKPRRRTLKLFRAWWRKNAGDPSQDALELLQALARGSNRDNPTSHPQARRADAAPPWYKRTGLYVSIGCAATVAAGATLFDNWSRRPAHDSMPATQTSAPRTVPAAPSAVVPEQTSPEIASVRTAMDQCDRQAASNPFSLYFLVIPVVSAGDARQWLAPIEEDYGSYSLLQSQPLLDGLRDRTLTLSSAPFRYFIVDSASGKIKSWSAETGVSSFKLDEAGFSKFKLGFDGSDQKPKWSKEFPRSAGVCYWVNVRLH
jgi:hypothetical protein